MKENFVCPGPAQFGKISKYAKSKADGCSQTP